MQPGVASGYEGYDGSSQYYMMQQHGEIYIHIYMSCIHMYNKKNFS